MNHAADEPGARVAREVAGAAARPSAVFPWELKPSTLTGGPGFFAGGQ
jgi:hypothetical protein